MAAGGAPVCGVCEWLEGSRRELALRRRGEERERGWLIAREAVCTGSSLTSLDACC